MATVRLALAGPHTVIGSSACAACPHAPAGCCTGPPPFDWSDVGRVASLGGRDWLLAEIAAGRLEETSGGLAIKRRVGLSRPGGPRVAKCAYHAERGCTIPPERRPATCNYYVCDAALDGHAAAERARALHAELAATYQRWDEAIAARLARARSSEGEDERVQRRATLDAARIDRLAAAFEELSAEGRRDPRDA